MKVSIEGMSCGHCVNAVTEGLKALAGVSNVVVDLAAKQATIEGNPDAAAVKEAIEDLGYDVVGIE